MKYTIQSNKYIFKNFIYIFPLVIIPAILLSLSADAEAIECLLDTLFFGKISELHFDHIFNAISILNFGSVQSIVFGLLGIVCVILFVALLMAFLEKHLRIGKRTLNGIFSKLNDNFTSTLGFVVLVLAIYELWTVILAALLFFLTKIAIVPLAYGLGIAVYVGMHLLLVYVLSLFYLWLPCMQITGFAPFEALHYSYQLVSPVKWGIIFGQLIFLFITEVLMALCVFTLSNEIVFMALTTLLYAILFMVFCVRMQLVYFDRDNIGRADLRYYSK